MPCLSRSSVLLVTLFVDFAQFLSQRPKVFLSASTSMFYNCKLASLSDRPPFVAIGVRLVLLLVACLQFMCRTDVGDTCCIAFPRPLDGRLGRESGALGSNARQPRVSHKSCTAASSSSSTHTMLLHLSHWKEGTQNPGGCADQSTAEWIPR